MNDVASSDIVNVVNVGVCVRPNSPELKDVYKHLESVAMREGIRFYLEEESARSFGFSGLKFTQLMEKSDILLSLGGDGTLLALVRKCEARLACIGINTGRLGFLSALNPENFDEFVKKLSNGVFLIKNHMLLECKVVRADGSIKKTFALNEFLISRQKFSGMIDIDAKVNGHTFNTYFCDGLIIATPTGSTAYNLSAGGSVVYPYCKNILLTPLAPHSFTQRPLIVEASMVLDFCVMQDSILIGDGQEAIDIYTNDKISIFASSKCAKLIYQNEYDYFKILREKFSWGKSRSV